MCDTQTKRLLSITQNRSGYVNIDATYKILGFLILNGLTDFSKACLSRNFAKTKLLLPKFRVF